MCYRDGEKLIDKNSDFLQQQLAVCLSVGVVIKIEIVRHVDHWNVKLVHHDDRLVLRFAQSHLFDLPFPIHTLDRVQGFRFVVVPQQHRLLKRQKSKVNVRRGFKNLAECSRTLIFSHLSSTSWSQERKRRPLYRERALRSFSSCSGVRAEYTS